MSPGPDKSTASDAGSEDALENRLARLEGQVNTLVQLVSRIPPVLDLDPELALTQARKSAEFILRELFCHHHGGRQPGRLEFEELLKKLNAQEAIPLPVQLHLRTVQAFGNAGAHVSRGSGTVSREDALPCLVALNAIVAWYFQDHLKTGAPPPRATRDELESPAGPAVRICAPADGAQVRGDCATLVALVTGQPSEVKVSLNGRDLALGAGVQEIPGGLLIDLPVTLEVDSNTIAVAASGHGTPAVQAVTIHREPTASSAGGASRPEASPDAGQQPIEAVDAACDAEGFFTEAGLESWLKSANALADGEAVGNRLLLYQTRKQRTWLLATNLRVLCLLDDSRTRTGNQLLQWTLALNKASPVKAGVNSRGKPVISLGPRTGWLYSSSLHGDPAALVARVEMMIDRAVGRPSAEMLPQLEKTVSNPRFQSDFAALVPHGYDLGRVMGPGTVLLVTGTWLPSELLDRPLAEAVRDEIGRRGYPDPFRRGIVMSDTWWFRDHELQKFPTISFGGPAANPLTEGVLSQGTVRPMGQGTLGWLAGPPLRIALSGQGADHLMDAVEVFLRSPDGLERFLLECWRRPGSHRGQRGTVRVRVSGSTSAPRVSDFCRYLGRAIAREADLVLVQSNGLGVGKQVFQGFREVSQEPDRWVSREAAGSRLEAVRNAGVVVVVGGGQGTRAELDLCLGCRIPVVIVQGSGGSADAAVGLGGSTACRLEEDLEATAAAVARQVVALTSP